MPSSISLSSCVTRLLPVVALVACASEGASPSDSADSARLSSAETPNQPAMVSLIDSAIAPAIAGVGGWNYRQAATADVTGDGTPETIVLTAQVEMYRGRPAWDDGQAWQVYVEFADSSRTYVYANRLQLGTLTMRLSRADSGQAATIVLIEHLPDRLRVAEAAIADGHRVVTRMMFERNLDPTGEVSTPQR